jgi:tRNA A37 threonylcarbamoyladenosine modification protein TsaB
MFVFIDSAVTGCNIAMADKANVLTIHQEPITRGHAEFIIPQYQKMMGECDKKSEDIRNWKNSPRHYIVSNILVRCLK